MARRWVGYARDETQAQVKRLNQLYRLHGFYSNHFIPIVKLQSKQRQGSRVKRVFDAPTTPYQRVLDSVQVSEADQAKLRAVHAQLDVVKLRQQIDGL